MPYKNIEDRRKNSRLYFKKNKEKILLAGRVYYYNNIEKEHARAKKYTDSHKKELALYRKINREAINKNARKKYKFYLENNPQYQIRKNIHTRLYVAIKNNYKKSDIHNLGCDLFEFKKYLKSKFKRGMTWENYGSKWHIDHIKPLSSFDLTDRKQLLECCHYLNTQPLWKKENLLKGTKII